MEHQKRVEEDLQKHPKLVNILFKITTFLCQFLILGKFWNLTEDEKPLVTKRKPLNLTFNELEEAAENVRDMDDLDYEGI